MPPRDNDSSSSPTSVKQHREQSKIKPQKMDPRAATVDPSNTKKKKASSRDKEKRKSKDGKSRELPREVGGSNTRLPGNDGMTVSQFLSQQQSLQREVETYRANSMYSNTNSSGRPKLLTNGDEDDYQPSRESRTVDTVPSDHPSSSIIQTHRTCTLCHRTLARSQFSERDRYLVHLSLGPGAVCRTCTMTGE
jgi:hypothetical protein